MIDWKRVSELRDEIGAEDFGEVVELFLEEVEAEIDKLRRDVVLDNLESQLHFLKGSALNLGFEDFSKHCQHGETTAASGQQEQINLAQILTSYNVSKTEFLAALDKLSTA